MPERSKLVALRIRNLGCIGPESVEIALDNIVCLVGRNNTGKSTVLRAYELAQGSKTLGEGDWCLWTPEGDCAQVELDVHIPVGIGNVAEKWKLASGDLKIVRSRWTWKVVGEKPERQTWDPEAGDGNGGWAEDQKAGGLDNVFNSRLPQPLRVGSLQDAFKEHEELLKLVTEPVATELKALQAKEGTALNLAVSNVVQAAMAPIAEFQADITRISEQVGVGFRSVFPNLNVKIDVQMEPPTIEATKSLLAKSSVRILEGEVDTALKQQGTGSQRALFWSLLQVRNMLVQDRKRRSDHEKEIAKTRIDIEKEKKKALANQKKMPELLAKLAELEGGIPPVDETVLPGHILLIDEPENALHPMAVRAARHHLYELAKDPNWQVMLSTHSPYFIDPLEDHTTIIRLERDDKKTAPRTFRTSTMQFSEDERANLRALLQLDTSLAEMFFGSYPIIVEGDTEAAAFMAAIVAEKNNLSLLVTVVPAKGKALIVPLIKLLRHFGTPFGLLHDSDAPVRRDGHANGSWTLNSRIIAEVVAARAAGLPVRYRISIPDFERALGGDEEGKDKPILAYTKVKSDAALRAKVQQTFRDLFGAANVQPFDGLEADSNEAAIMDALSAAVSDWAAANAPDDARFKV